MTAHDALRIIWTYILYQSHPTALYHFADGRSKENRRPACSAITCARFNRDRDRVCGARRAFVPHLRRRAPPVFADRHCRSVGCARVRILCVVSLCVLAQRSSRSEPCAVCLCVPGYSVGRVATRVSAHVRRERIFEVFRVRVS